VRTLMGSYRDFRQLTSEALDFALARFPTVDRALRDDLLDAYRRLQPFAEVEPTLRALKQRGARLAILSNGSPGMLAGAIQAAKLDGLFDALFSVDAIATYKTHPETYRLVTQAWDVEAAAVSFQSSNRWDIAGAARFGFHTVWVNRSGQPDEYADLPPARTIRSLDELLDG
jgi:2-haloacid dehalogenase